MIFTSTCYARGRMSALLSWTGTTNHTRIAAVYGAFLAGCFVVAGGLALAIRVEFLDPDMTIMSAQAFNRAFSLHGTLMVFIVSPGLLVTFGNLLLPPMLGARDVAYPRLNRLCLHLFITGSIVHIMMMCLGGVDGGFMLYSPYFSSPREDLAALPVLAVGLSLILTSVNFIVTFHRRPAVELRLARVPHFVWSLYGAAIVMTTVGLTTFLTLMAVLIERVLGVGALDPFMVSTPELRQMVLSAYASPLMLSVLTLPCFGVIAEVLCVHGRRDTLGFRGIVPLAAYFLIDLLRSLGVTQESAFALVGVNIVGAIVIFQWVASLCSRDVHQRAVGWYALGFLWLFVVNGFVLVLTSALALLDVHSGDTYLVTGMFHLVLGGNFFYALVLGLHHWWPRITGKMFDERAAKVGAAMLLTGLIVTFMTQVVMGLNGLPRRYYGYLPEYTTMHRISTIGASILGLAFLWISFYLLRSLRTGPAAPENPWSALSLEWRGASDPRDVAVTRGPYDFPEAERGSLKGRGVGS